MSRLDEFDPQDADHVAADWYSRARSGRMTLAQEAELQAWLDADPAHQSAYDAVERAWSALDLIRVHPRVLEMRDALPPEPPRLLRRAFFRRAIAASLALALVGAGAATGFKVWPPDGVLDSQTLSTGAGQRTVVTLADGSEVMLNGGTLLRTKSDPDARIIYLDKGQAFFRVAKDRAHPFVVHAGGRKITALGTAFDVRVGPDRFAVTLVEGKVRVETPVAPARPAIGGPAAPQRAVRPATEATEMVAGSQLVADDTRRWAMARTDVEQATSWTRDQLVFESEPLAKVVAEMNRHSVRKIAITDPAVGEILVSGNFRPGDVDGFARAVQAYEYARISAVREGRIELSAH
ncbi:MAG TPA: FecR domain-containing protein [Caulobacteraceae bacterium]|nr:FecR domain-containing protein [Caulobacteraceae bacterium]